MITRSENQRPAFILYSEDLPYDKKPDHTLGVLALRTMLSDTGSRASSRVVPWDLCVLLSCANTFVSYLPVHRQDSIKAASIQTLDFM